MNLRQWFTYLPALTTIIDKMRTGSERDHAGLLGMTWKPKDDMLQFPRKAIVIPPGVKLTKRQVLSSASSTFDPLGLISPALVPAKKFISALWDKGFDWDEVLPDELQQQYNEINETKEIEAASSFVTSRYLDFDKTLQVEMHVFCDACPTTAAGCCVFFVQNEKARFIGSKVKLSSSKHARTVPQWELIAMVMGARLGAAIRQMFSKDFPSISSHYWTDSTICLHWLYSTKQLPLFIRNRTTEIFRFTDLSSWSHVSSTNNPAGILSRGCSVDELLQSALWERGPPWLTEHSLWPRWSTKSLAEDDVVSATAVDSHVQGAQSHSGSLQDLINISHFQSYERVLRVISYVLRFISNLKHASGRSRGSRHSPSVIDLAIPVFTAAETSQAEVVILRAHQIQHFRQEREFLLKEQTRPTHRHVQPRPQLVRQLNLKLNPDGLLVAPGKLEHAMLEQDAREPIFITLKSQFTTLLVRSVHERQLHAGVRATIVALRKRFWLPSARSEIAGVFERCVN